MTEVPEHLLRRSRERREALGLAAPGEGAPPSVPSEEAPAAEATTEEPAAAAPPAVPEAAAVPAVPTEELRPYIAPTPPKRIPMWMYPVLAVLPFWAFVYFGAFASHQKLELTPLQLGQQTYVNAGCAGCHGATGGGGVGPKLHGGEAKLTFPNIQDHINWVKSGSAGVKGKPYGDPNRAGGQHIAHTGLMPAFGSTLSDAQIQAVVAYERDQL